MWPLTEWGAVCKDKFLGKGSRLLTEQQIVRSWRKLFHQGELDDETFDQAEALLVELRPENPLRHRLGTELAELRQRKLQKQD